MQPRTNKPRGSGQTGPGQRSHSSGRKGNPENDRQDPQRHQRAKDSRGVSAGNQAGRYPAKGVIRTGGQSKGQVESQGYGRDHEASYQRDSRNQQNHNPKRRLSVKFADTEDYYYYQEQKGEKGEPERPKKAQKKAKQAREQQVDTADQWVRKQPQEPSNAKAGQKGPRNAQEPSGDNYRFNEGGTRDPKAAKGSGSHEQLSRSADPKDRDGNYHFRKSQPKQYKPKDERNVNKKHNTEYEWVVKKDPKGEKDTSEQPEKPAGEETTGDGASPAGKEEKADKSRPNFKDRNYGFLERRNNGKDKDGKQKGPVGKGQAYYVLKTKTEGEPQAEGKPEEAPKEVLAAPEPSG